MIDDFIGVFDNVISNELCDELIKVYEDSNKLNFAISRQSMGKEKVKQDNNLVFVTSKLHIKDDIFFEKIQPSVQEFCNLAWKYYMLNMQQSMECSTILHLIDFMIV